MIFGGNNANANSFYIYETFRQRRNNNGDKVSRKQFKYLPLGSRLQWLYTSEATTSHIRWHAEHHNDDGKMIHPPDAQPLLTYNAHIQTL